MYIQIIINITYYLLYLVETHYNLVKDHIARYSENEKRSGYKLNVYQIKNKVEPIVDNANNQNICPIKGLIDTSLSH